MADVQIDQDAANIPAINVVDQSSDPSAPGSGHVLLYVKAGTLYVRLSNGTVAAVGGVPSLPEGRLAIGDGDDLLSALALGTEGDVVTADASGFATWAAPAASGGGGGGSPITLTPFNYSAIGTGVLTFGSNPAQMGNSYYYLATYGNGNYIDWKVYLAAGTYSIRFHGVSSTDHSIYSIRIDGTEVMTFDDYSNPLVWNAVYNQTGIVVASSGLKTIAVVANGKNAASSEYGIAFSGIGIWRTA